MTVGAFSTGITGGGNGTVLDLDQPEFVVGVPAGTWIKPFYADCGVLIAEATTALDEAEILVAADVLGYWATEPTPTGAAVTHTPESPVNMRTNLGRGSACHCGSAFVVDMVTMNLVGTEADPVLDMELARVPMMTNFRDDTGANDTILRLVYQPSHPPLLVGPATLLGYWGGTRALTGFAVVQWVEGPLSMLDAP